MIGHELYDCYIVQIVIYNSVEFLPHGECSTYTLPFAVTRSVCTIQTGDRGQVTFGETEYFADGNQRRVSR